MSAISGIIRNVYYDREFFIPSRGMYLNSASYPGTGNIGSTVKNYVLAFADSGSEAVEFSLYMPSDINIFGYATFKIIGRPKTPVASRYVSFDVDHYAINTLEAMDGSFTSTNSGDLAVTGSSSVMDILSWTVKLSALSWSARDWVQLKVTRNTPTGTNLSGDYYMAGMLVTIPCVAS